MSIQLSSLLQRFSEPATLKMSQMGRDLKDKGIDVINLSIGEPDFDTPSHIKIAAEKAIEENWSHYPPVAGFPDLREACCVKFKRDNNLDYKPENIVVSTGAKQSLVNVILALVDKDDEVIIPTPYWVTYSEQVKIAGGKVVEIHTSPSEGYKLTAAALEAAITDKTKLFMFSSPCNPSGAVYSREELKNLVAVFEKHHNIFILSDEIYEYINYIGKHESIAQFPSIKNRVIIVNGLSKGFAMTGWRLGYIAADPIIAKACSKIQGQFTSGACSITQKAAVTALTGDLEPSKKMTEEFTRRKTRTMELIAEIPGLICPEPEGAFYVFPDMSKYFGKSNGTEIIKDSADMSLYLLNTAHVSSVMGEAFGEPKCVRFSFANSMENIEKAWSRVKAALLQLK